MTGVLFDRCPKPSGPFHIEWQSQGESLCDICDVIHVRHASSPTLPLFALVTTAGIVVHFVPVVLQKVIFVVFHIRFKSISRVLSMHSCVDLCGRCASSSFQEMLDSAELKYAFRKQCRNVVGKFFAEHGDTADALRLMRLIT